MSSQLGIEPIADEVRRRIIDWEKKNWVPYPWRVDRTPYKVLIAEILLKRTTRQAVAREFPRFIKKFPDLYTIYRAPLMEVAEALRNLGLYNQRAVQLKELAKILVEKYDGKVPDDWGELTSLPGVGSYVAGAVLSFGYGKPAPVVDSNVMRLLGRLLGLELNKHEACLRILWRLVPQKDHEYFNYGLIDLGALVCNYRKPVCRICPLKDLCVMARAQALEVI
jgi:A/G-specific adenine glycosylase